MRAVVANKGRNAEWAEQAIRESVSITDDEALRIKVTDLIADSVPELLKKLNGKTIEKYNHSITLNTKDARVVRIRAGWRFRILIQQPDYMFLDEATASLDEEMEETFYQTHQIPTGLCNGDQRGASPHVACLARVAVDNPRGREVDQSFGGKAFRGICRAQDSRLPRLSHSGLAALPGIFNVYWEHEAVGEVSLLL